MKRTTIWLSQEDRDAIGIIGARYGLNKISAIIRFALRILASHELKVKNASNQALQDSTENKPDV